MVATKEQRYKWVILGVCFFMIFVCLGFCSTNKGIYLTAITEALNIPRGLFSINDTCRYIASAVINLFFGILLQRFGYRKMVAVGFATMIVSTLLFAYAQDIVTFCIGGVFCGIGFAFTSTNMASSIMRRWFDKDIGKYTGIVFAANGLGATVASMIATPLINEPGNPFGYRNSYLVVAAILAVTGILSVILLKKPPAQPPVSAGNGNVNTKKRSVNWVGLEFSEARRKPFFYIAAGVILLSGLSLQGVAGAYAAHLQDVGFEPGFVTAIVSLSSLALTASKILAGWLYDRFGLGFVMTMCQIAAIGTFLCLAFVCTGSFGVVLAVAFAVLYAIALPLETLLVPLLVNDFFGARSYDKILGLFAAFNYIGYALGAPIVNVCFDWFGSYKPVLIVFVALMLIASFAFRFALRSVQKIKRP